MSVLQREINCLNKQKIDVFEKTWTLTCKTHVKVTCFTKTWNEPTVTTDILPQTIPRKAVTQVKCLTKVLESIFPETT